MDKLSEVVKFLQGKATAISVAEINQICAILQEEINKNAQGKKEKAGPDK